MPKKYGITYFVEKDDLRYEPKQFYLKASVDTMKRVMKRPQEVIQHSVTKEIRCSQSALSKIWSEAKQNEKVVKRKHTG